MEFSSSRLVSRIEPLGTIKQYGERFLRGLENDSAISRYVGTARHFINSYKNRQGDTSNMNWTYRHPGWAALLILGGSVVAGMIITYTFAEVFLKK